MHNHQWSNYILNNIRGNYQVFLLPLTCPLRSYIFHILSIPQSFIIVFHLQSLLVITFLCLLFLYLLQLLVSSFTCTSTLKVSRSFIRWSTIFWLSLLTSVFFFSLYYSIDFVFLTFFLFCNLFCCLSGWNSFIMSWRVNDESFTVKSAFFIYLLSFWFSYYLQLIILTIFYLPLFSKLSPESCLNASVSVMYYDTKFSYLLFLFLSTNAINFLLFPFDFVSLQEDWELTGQTNMRLLEEDIRRSTYTFASEKRRGHSRCGRASDGGLGAGEHRANKVGML